MKEVMARVAIYTRVSTQDQTVENQLPALRNWAEVHGHEVARVYEEHESAWKSGRQRMLQRLLDDCQNGDRPDIVAVWSLDRLSRQGIARVLGLIDWFRVYGVRVVSLNEPWTETEGPMTELLFAVFAWAAQYESRIRSERTLAGLERARGEGKRLGRPPGAKDKSRRSRRGYLLRYAGPEARRSHGK